ncbi:MAG: hypothetical protein FJ279_10715, partial [Planctomycetes bacterium]|nr:hypothetical protein [Planctomycetota bacterium]
MRQRRDVRSESACGSHDDRRRLAAALLVAVLTQAVMGVVTVAQQPAALPIPLGPVVRTEATKADDLLRGFTDEELAAAQKAVPERPDPPLGAPVPRKVNVAGMVFVDANQNGRLDAGERGLSGAFVSDGEGVSR